MIQDYRDIIADQVRDPDGVLAADQIDRAIGLAVARYGVDRPRQTAEEFAASDDGKLIDLPPGWQTESRLVNLEFPIDQDPMALIDARVRLLPLGQQLSLAQGVSSGDTLRITYTVAHELDDATDTIPAADQRAVAFLAASYCACQLASHYAHQTDSTIQADAVDHVSKSEKFSRQAGKLEAAYYAHLGIRKNQVAGASAVADLDLTLRGGGDRLIHSGRYR